MKKVRILVLLVVILVLGSAIVYQLGTPQVLAFSPDHGEDGVPSQTPLSLTFSRPMQSDSVTGRISIQPPLNGSFHWEANTLVFSPDEPWPSGANVEVRLASGARAAGLLSFPLTHPIGWTFTVGRPRLVYLYPADDLANIYVLNPFTGESQRLTNSRGGVVDFHVKSDGTAIYYSVNNADGGQSIYRLTGPALMASPSVDVPEPELVLDCGRDLCSSPQISPDGDFLAYMRTSLQRLNPVTYPQIWLLPILPEGSETDGEPPAPFLAGEEDHQTSDPAWSPAGLLTYYDSTREAFVVLEPYHGGQTYFANQTGQPGAWDPTGQFYVVAEISYAATGDPDKTGLEPITNSHLIRFDRLSGQTMDLTQAENLEDASAVYSPDGTLLAFARKYLDVSRWTPGRQLWIMRSDGSDAHQMTSQPFYNHFEFAWSPDNTQLVFVRFNQDTLTEPPEIWLMNPINGQSVRLVIGGYAPQWMP